MRRILGAFLMTGALLTPVVMQAKDKDDHRLYDRDRRDYHEWNENEERAYRHWVEAERHQRYREWKHASRAQQREYWRWRHEHPDWR
jgi:hypothetical protein